MTDTFLLSAFLFVTAIVGGGFLGFQLRAAALRDQRREIEEDIAQFKRALGYAEPRDDEIA